MAKLDLPKPADLKGLEKNLPISDPALPTKALVIDASADLARKVGGFTFSGLASAGARIAIVNSRDDEDPTGLLALQEGSTDELEGQVVVSRVPFKEGSGYVCLVGINAGLKAAGGESLRDLGFKFNGAAEVSLGCVKNFPADTPVHDAVAVVAGAFPTFLNVDDVLGLGSNEAVSYAFNGELGLTLTVDLADLAGSIAASADRIVAAAGRGVRVGAQAKLSATIRIQDSFRLVASRARQGGIRIFVAKESERAIGAGASLGAEVAFDDSEMLKPLDALTRSLFDYPWAKLEPLLQKTVDRLDEKERKMVDEVLDKAGREKFEGALNLGECKEIVAGLREALSREFQRTFAAKWTFNYSRLTAEAAIFQAVLDEAAFRRHHADLLRFKLDRLLAENAVGVEIEAFLAKRTKIIRFDHGLTLSWGDFTVLAGRSTGERAWVTLSDHQGARRASFLGKRGYTSTWLGRKSSHRGEFGATMPAFSTANPLRAVDYELGLSLSFNWENVRFDDDTVLEIADHAAVVGAIGPDDMAETLELLRNDHRIPKNARGSAIVHLEADNGLLVQLLAVISGSSRVDLTARALGGALCYRKEGVYAVRQSVAARANVYAPVWKAYLLEEDLDASDVARAAWSALSRQHKRLADAEYSFVEPNGDRMWSAGAMVRLHNGTYPFRDTIKSLWFGLEQLDARARTGGSDKLLETAYGNIKKTWEDHFPSRMFAALLGEAAISVPKGTERLRRRLEFKVGDTAVVFARGSAGW